jgi:hypothetical protein
VYSRIRRAKQQLKRQLELLAADSRQLQSTETDLERWAHSLKVKARGSEPPPAKA